MRHQQRKYHAHLTLILLLVLHLARLYLLVVIGMEHPYKHVVLDYIVLVEQTPIRFAQKVHIVLHPLLKYLALMEITVQWDQLFPRPVKLGSIVQIQQNNNLVQPELILLLGKHLVLLFPLVIIGTVLGLVNVPLVITVLEVQLFKLPANKISIVLIQLHKLLAHRGTFQIQVLLLVFQYLLVLTGMVHP